MWLITVLISLFAVQPLLEYGLHRFVHHIALMYHTDHHRKWSGGTYWSYEGDWNVYLLVALAVLLRWHIAALMLLKYEIAHVVAHACPGSYLHRHHFIHHRKPQCNYSFSAIWPDRLFGTLACTTRKTSPAS